MFQSFYRPDGTTNITRKKSNGTYDESLISNPLWDSENDRCYMLWSDKCILGPSIFEGNPYSSYADFVQEFKDKLEAYLPENFDWNKHLGIISYAQYA